MEPRIRYAQTADGVSIAFWTLGEGMPLVVMPWHPFSHIQLDWEMLGWRRYYERLAEKRMLVRYDGRGTGLSERNVDDQSLDALLLDLDAVVDRLRLENLALFGSYNSGPVAIAWAARHPDRVSHLVLTSCFARGSDFRSSSRMRAFTALRETDWETYTEAMAQFAFGWSGTESARLFTALVRECSTPEAIQKFMASARGFDATALLPQVKSPTLVLHGRQNPFPTMDIARDIASRIPDARLMVLDEIQYFGASEAAGAAIDEFLSEGEEASAAPELPEGMAVILFADIAESTALTEQLGDAAFRAKARELDSSLRSVIRETGGTPVEGKVLGDGVLAVFTSARQAIDCALRCEAAGEPVRLQLHLGIHAGDVIREGNNVYGGAVNIAARIAGAAEPGEVLVSDTVRSLGRTSADVTFDDRGEHTLKGVGEPQRLFAVKGAGAS